MTTWILPLCLKMCHDIYFSQIQSDLGYLFNTPRVEFRAWRPELKKFIRWFWFNFSDVGISYPSYLTIYPFVFKTALSTKKLYIESSYIFIFHPSWKKCMIFLRKKITKWFGIYLFFDSVTCFVSYACCLLTSWF